MSKYGRDTYQNMILMTTEIYTYRVSKSLLLYTFVLRAAAASLAIL